MLYKALPIPWHSNRAEKHLVTPLCCRRPEAGTQTPDTGPLQDQRGLTPYSKYLLLELCRVQCG